MFIEVRHSDAVRQQDIFVAGVTREHLEVSAQGCGPHTIHVGNYCLDENHAQALVLALQAAIAEVQARAVSR